MPSKADLCYIAGFFDGEGSICLHKRNKYKCVRFCVQIVNTDKAVLQYIRRVFGFGDIYEQRPENKKNNWKQAWKIVYTKPQIIKLLTAIAPYLRIKKRHATLILKYFKLMDRTSTADTWRTEVVDGYTLKFAEWNRRGL